MLKEEHENKETQIFALFVYVRHMLWQNIYICDLNNIYAWNTAKIGSNYGFNLPFYPSNM